MPFPTYAVSTELDAVNQILSSVGQAPVTTLDLQNPEVFMTVNTIRECSRQIQLEGWTYNTERNYPMQPDATTSKIPIPPGVLSIDSNRKTHNDTYDLVMRNGFLYDRYNHKDTFDKEIKVDIVWFFDFEYLPPALQEYITAKAARMCATKMVGDPELNQLLAEQEGSTRAALIEYECQQGDYSMFGHRDGQSYYNTYQPYQALSRQ